MKIRNILLSTALVGSLASCNMDERYFSQVTPDNFVESETNIYQLLSRPFGHWQAFVKSHMFNANEMTSDEFICPARTTGDWYNGGEYMARHYHTMDWQDGYADTNWKEAMQGIARCLTVIEQVNATNYAALNMTEDDRARHLAQVQALSAYFYMIGMDWFGGLPIYESTSDPLRPRNTVKETFDHTELAEACDIQSPQARDNQPAGRRISYKWSRRDAACRALLQCRELHRRADV